MKKNIIEGLHEDLETRKLTKSDVHDLAEGGACFVTAGEGLVAFDIPLIPKGRDGGEALMPFDAPLLISAPPRTPMAS